MFACRKVRIALFLLLSGPFLAAAVPARAEITHEELDFFIKESNAQYRSPGADVDAEDVLYLAAKIGKTPAKAIELYAGARHISPERAAREAMLIILASRHSHACREASSREACDLMRNPALIDAIRSAGFEDSSGQALLAVGKNLIGYSRPAAAFLNLVRKHPAVETIALGLFVYTEDFVYLLPLLGRQSIAPHALLPALARVDFEDAELDLAALDSARQRFDGGSGLLISRLLIDRLLETGLTRDAVELYSQIKPADRPALWPMPVHLDRVWVAGDLTQAYVELAARLAKGSDEEITARNGIERHTAERIRTVSTNSLVNLATALFAEGQRAEARRLLMRVRTEDLDYDIAQRLAFVRELLKPSLKDDEIYDAFVEGRQSDTKRWKMPGGSTRGIKGWLRSLSEGVPVFQDLGHQYLSAKGYPAIARYLLVMRTGYERDDGKLIYESFGSELGPGFDRSRARYRERLAAAERIYKTRSDAARKSTAGIAPTPVHVTERPVVFEERPLPPGLKPFNLEEATAEGAADDRGPAVPDGLKLPVEPYQVVRLEKTGEDYVLIFLSQALDPVGEVSRGGYWVVKSRAGGREWERPVYLGLQQFFPYMVTPESNLPLMDGEALQIEVLVRELDPDSISFPPVALRSKRRQDGLYLRFDWRKITRDGDSDGLTDIVEHRMGLDPSHPDTDRDGITDGLDSLPLTAFRARGAKDAGKNELAIAILQEVLGHERQAIIIGDAGRRRSGDPGDLVKSAFGPRPAIDPMHTTFLVADPDIFSGVQLPARLLVYGPDAAEVLEKQYGAFFPVRLAWVFSNRNGTKHCVIWSAGWTGGGFRVVKTDAGYKVEVLSRWVT